MYALSLFLMTMNALSSVTFPWGQDSDPVIMSSHFEKNFEDLPTSGSVIDKTKYWSGDYWPLRKGNINYRWYARQKIGFDHQSPDLKKLRTMTIPELAEFAPSEKYDLYLGRYDYPLRNEVAKIADINTASWEGICHGWAPASMNHEEPTPKLMVNPDGIEIPFGSTDIKALLSYYYAFKQTAAYTYQMGKRCYYSRPSNSDQECLEDMNAGAFHIVLANRLGYDGVGVIADIDRFDQVWNHPLVSYESKVNRTLPPDRTSAPGTKKRIDVKTTIKYVDENGHDWHPVIGTKKQAYNILTYQYFLEIDAKGDIIGGTWISSQRPDFVWIMPRPRKFDGILSRLSDLL